ncbi:MAG: RGCVC family protein [Pseudonocardia sp.]
MTPRHALPGPPEPRRDGRHTKETVSEMTSTEQATQAGTANAVTPREPTDGGQPCAVCPHPWPAHDALGMRFCTATAASASTRGCICR